MADWLAQIASIWTQLNFLWGVIAGIGGKIVYDKLAEPHLKIAKNPSSPLRLETELDPRVLRQAEGPNIRADVLAYRVKVTNKQKRLLNAPAKNCVAWLDLDGASESYQLSWVGSKEAVTINVGDSREVDVCGLAYRWGVVIAPTEAGYNFPKPRPIGGAGIPFMDGWLRITSENAKLARKRISIDVDENHTALGITLN